MKKFQIAFIAAIALLWLLSFCSLEPHRPERLNLEKDWIEYSNDCAKSQEMHACFDSFNDMVLED